MLIVYNGTVLTFDENDSIIRNGAVVIDGGSIEETGPCDNIIGQYHDAELIDAHGGIIMPGLVNMRIQSRHILNDCEPGSNARLAFDKRLTLNAVKYAAYAAALECIKNGVTTVFDSAFVPNDIAGTLQTMSAAYSECGLRCCLSFETSELLGLERLRDAAEENKGFIDYCRYYKSPAVAASFGIGPVSQQSDFVLQLIRSTAPTESGFTVRLSAKTGNDRSYTRSEIERLAEFGLLNEKTIIGECSQLSSDELDIIHSKGAAIALTSASDTRMGIPGMCAEELENSFSELCIGTGIAGMDLFEAARNEGFYSAVRGHKGTAQVSAKALLKKNPSISGRQFNCRMGSLTAGAIADVIVLDVDLNCCDDADSIIEHLIRHASGRACIHTVSRGRVLMKDRQILSVDEDRLSKEIARVHSRICK